MNELQVGKESVKKILSEKSKNYLIPEYQRPYEWDEDKCKTLWDDILNFAMPENNPDKFKENDEYFLGSIVTFNNETENSLEVIDGQQRITIILLLLRAIYNKLEPAEDKQSQYIKKEIEPCIWQTSGIPPEPQKDKIKISTKVATDKDREAFISILKTGSIIGKDIYSRNFQYFKEWVDEYVTTYPVQFYTLCDRILKNCIFFPIECSSQDVALRIFTTLNDRGMPLADSDIFKAQLYKFYNTKNKQDDFIKQWQELSEICDDITKNQKTNQNTIDEIFTLYMYWLRADEGIKDTTVPGLRKYFEHNQYERLKKYNVVNDVISLANFWEILTNKYTPNEMEISEKALKYIHALDNFPNNFWKYNLTVYFFANKDNDDKLDDNFTDFIRKTLAFCFVSYITKPGISYLKNGSIPVFGNIAKRDTFNYPIFKEEDFARGFRNIYTQSKYMIKPILLWEAYSIDEQVLIGEKTKTEIEHILPKHWKSSSYKEWKKDDATEYLEKIGNKIILDKKTNIQAGDGFFKEKKNRWYNSSPIKVVNKLAEEYPHEDWIKEDIEKRENNLLNAFVAFAKQYGIIEN